ncbi:type I-E CRISPR-associated protein Cas5/CasD [Streptomyces alfalfae]|uniref:Type I-E CRISPR-associated protein Cas5/CasD n=1 Tax=Streptomyces alfalfae TaxID=1642299 RepID=A0ABM6GNY7_9ACTN|nr:type I-E CRISPR-associated protein Cas5/CasD [Streptomyces alfalfae]APY85570.1 type I-E CRISPR-associated protein Cas5/CasD [Streptomyces alfalfae]AYA15923.1 type I-E CRISPR-associated protein Cas5/CasD [Streptomyces fradiae]RXX39397.1 type I-E CRISPR-associated protein Cas5/CasD [Streptomyces alfalfae]RZM96313.1 type I-E CRISPR-associated protein Cas5/CasD [Streptomyces alfalfae]
MTTPHPAPEPGLLLRLTGPLQSWGLHSHFNERDTASFPTRSGVIGMLASALGRHRDQPIGDLTTLHLTVRTDRPGVLLHDLHTVGGGLPGNATVTTAEGKKRPGDTGTLLTHRYYLADAAFTLALTTPQPTPDTQALLDRCANALRNPQWPLHLGRRSCPPEGPLLLGQSDNALHHLIHLPLAAPPPRKKAAEGSPVEFLADRPLTFLPAPVPTTSRTHEDGTHASGQLNDQPVSYHPSHRAYRARPLYRRTLHLPHAQFAGLGVQQLTALRSYLDTRLHTPEGSRR